MNLVMFAIWDAKAKGFLQPFYSVNEHTATREFKRAVNDGDTAFCRFPEDYVLYRVGLWCPLDGSIDVPSTPEVVVTASAVKELL